MTLMRELLKHETERDKQTRIGPSTAGSLCDLCIVEGFRGGHRNSKYWLPARIGTGVHTVLEEKAEQLMGDYVLTEQKVVVCELRGYGVISGTADLTVLPNLETIYPTAEPVLLDWKTTDRAKLAFIRQVFLAKPKDTDSRPLKEARFKCDCYINQTLLYAAGLIRAGVPVGKIVLSFVARDGKTDRDFFEVEFEVNHDRIESIVTRLQHIYDHLDDTEWEGHPMCFVHGER